MPLRTPNLPLAELLAVTCLAPLAVGQADGGTGIVRPVGPSGDVPKGTDALEELIGDLQGEGELDDVRREWALSPFEGVVERTGPPPRPETWQPFVRPHMEFLFDADIDGTETEIETNRLGVGVGAQRFFGETGYVSVLYDYEFSVYQFNGPTGFVEGSNSPIEDVIQNSLSLTWVGDMADRDIGFAGQLGVRSGMEVNAEFGDSLTYRALGGVRFRQSEDLIWNVGAFVQQELNGDLLLVPILGVDWRLSDDLKIRTPGPGLELRYRIDGNTEYYLSMLYEVRDYRLDNSGPVLSGSIEDQAVAVRTGFEWSWAQTPGGFPDRRFSLYAGLVPWRNLTFYSNTDVELEDVDADAGALAGLRFQLGF